MRSAPTMEQSVKLLLLFGAKQNRSPAERVRFWEEEVPGISEHAACGVARHSRGF